MDENTRVKENMGLVFSVANRFRKIGENHGMSIEDLVQIGSIGLLRAIRAFDEERGFQLSTYATFKIRAEIQRYISDTGDLIKFSREHKEIAGKIWRKDLMYKPVKEIALELGVEIKSIKQALEYLRAKHPVWLDKTMDSGEDKDTSLGAIIGKSQDYTGIFVEEFLESLSPVERIVAEGTANGLFQREMAAIAGVSQGQISRVQRGLVGRLEKYLKHGQAV